ncbi:Hsp70 family protein [Oleiagrimonas sp. C23AA]|uniref:Hsp70 family protein n=1 Tax=Oleiagrimonas sp. C23AA TaxID=2719047 RepID=UPI001423A046|nr:Hsp70 family protein [Oleiagrimonas sp. C23AA]NII09715.1 Hsp70 family protein [Oleiagrimonas sp. C23AA]
MHIGIDFGTSYSAAAAVVDGELTLIRFGQEEQFRTAVFFPEVVPDPNDFELTGELEAELETQIRAARTQARQMGVERSEAQIRRDALRVVRRQWMENQSRDSAVSIASFQHALFGEEAVEAYLEAGDGNLIESPKSMFGFRFDPQVRRVIVHIATHILEHIRLTASRQLGESVRGAVIGRPVAFRSSMGEKGQQQAIEIIEEAAREAGFDSISFLEEPAAAAMHYHKRLDHAQPALIVDIGGGTTDVTFAELGGAHPKVSRNWGLPKGGTDLDVGVSLQSFMPLLGKNVTAVPPHHFIEAASVHNMPKQREFRQQDYRRVPEPYRSRLTELQELGATTRLNQEAEHTKIVLSRADEHRSDLGFLEKGLTADTDAAAFAQAIAPFIEGLQQTLGEVSQALPQAPASVFLTGGTSRSPQVKSAVEACFPSIPLVQGDPSLGVVSGLAVAAAEAQQAA